MFSECANWNANFPGIYRVHTDLEKSLNLTLVLENSWNFKMFQNSAICLGIVLEFCKIALENVKLFLKIVKYTDSFPFFLDLCDARKKTV